MKEDLVASYCISSHAKEDKNSVVSPKFVCIEMRHLVIQGCHAGEEAESCEDDSVLASFSMLYPELLTINKTIRVLLDKVGSFKANVQTQLLLTLNELVYVMDCTGFLAAPALTHVVPSGLTLKHFFFYLIINKYIN